jgi:UPF0755 protein
VKRGLLLFAALALLMAATAAAVAWHRYQTFLATPLDVPAGGMVFQLEPGETGNGIVSRISRLGLTRHGWEWRMLMRLQPRIYRAGEYQIEAGIRPAGLLELLSSGRVIQYRFTLVEGWTFSQLAAALAANPVLEHLLDLDTPVSGTVVADAFGIDHPEGWFLPETYQFTRGHSDRDILQRSYRAMQDELDRAWAGRDPDLPLKNPYELLILASIIEKETALDEERGEIAGVFVRRLLKGMRLQTDPTVIYGMGEAFDGDIRRRDLKTDTPYNTYTRHGLPPTPIAMPGRASLDAAARPASGDTLYFVADGEGGHTFSRTLEEHQEAVRKLMGKS